MSKILVVFGATGQQGGSVAKHVLSDPELSKEYKVRAVTRDPSKPAAQALQKLGAEVVKGDADDAASLAALMKGAHTVFSVTVSILDAVDKTPELTQGKAIADAAVAAGAQFFIFSTLPNVSKISDGKLTTVEHFDLKAKVEEYVRTLPIKKAFYVPAYFMQNFENYMAPQPTGDGNFAVYGFVTPQTQVPLIDIASDTGKFVGAILADPEKYDGKSVIGATLMMSYEDAVAEIARISGKNVKYTQLPESAIRGFMPPLVADMLVGMFYYYQDFGYYGAPTKVLVQEAPEVARGKLVTFEEYITKNIPAALK
jgi:uncharacterized protein YbjT (DUF2867 family)